MTVCSMIRSKVKVTTLKSRKFDHFQRLFPPPFITGAGKWLRIHKLGHNTESLSGPLFWSLSYFLCHVTLKLAVSRSRPPVPYGANLYCLSHVNDFDDDDDDDVGQFVDGCSSTGIVHRWTFCWSGSWLDHHSSLAVSHRHQEVVHFRR